MAKFATRDGSFAVVQVNDDFYDVIIFPSFAYFPKEEKHACFACGNPILNGEVVWFGLQLDEERHFHDRCISGGDPRS
jgi:NAD-dependent SIR2 family protein deacetylase